MNEIIKKQLEACVVANVPYFDQNTTEIFIEKGSVMRVTPYQVGKCYLLEVAMHVIDPSEQKTLAANWNKGLSPKHRHYKCEILQVMGKMIKIVGCGYDMESHTDTLDMWEGWLPQSSVKIISELN